MEKSRAGEGFCAAEKAWDARLGELSTSGCTSGSGAAGREQDPAQAAFPLNALTIDPQRARQGWFPSQSVPAAIIINPGD